MLQLDYDREILGDFLWLGPSANTTDDEVILVPIAGYVLDVCLRCRLQCLTVPAIRSGLEAAFESVWYARGIAFLCRSHTKMRKHVG